MSNSILKAIQNAWHLLVNEAQAEIVTYATPAIQYIEANGGKLALSLAETILAGAAAGTPWKELVAAFIAAAKAQGLDLAEKAAEAALNFAKANMVAQGQATA